MKQRTINEKTLNIFRQHLIDEDKSKNTIEKYMRDVRAFFLFVNGLPITKEMVIEYKHKLEADNYAVRSINSMLACINSFLDFLSLADCKVKTVKMQRQIYCPEEKELTRAEYSRLVDAAKRRNNSRLSLILQTICSSGIRISELQYITVEAVRVGVAEVFCKSKIRSVFLVKKLRNKLLRYAAQRNIKSGMIFASRTGKPLNRTNIWREMKNLCLEANVSPTKVFPHNLRHLFAKEFYSAEKDISKLADILGHSSINTTRIYIISSGREHRRFMENLHLVL